MKIGIVTYSDDSETVWNAFRFGNFAEICPLSTMKDLYDIITSSDKVITF
ncbi:MAG: hypothetical protein U9O85_07700 [Euryarchaeota archaeon]|nr:hypothetical protein [Euryarchaeota archaeon]